MADGDNVVETIDRVEVTPAAEGSETVEAGATDPETGNEGAAEGDEQGADKDPADESPDGRTEALVTAKPAPAEAPKEPGADGLMDIPGETPKERAMRVELTRFRARERDARAAELAPPPPARQPRELTEEDKAVIGKYPADQLNALREVIPVLAKEMGFVKEEDMQGQTYAATAQGELDGFLDRHKEYLPENDSDGTLWNALKDEFGLYKAPTNPRDYRKVLERAHQTVFGIKPAGSLPTNKAAERRVEVASHGGTAGSGQSGAGGRTAAPAAATAYRFDMLKGFSDEEIAGLQDKAGA